MKSNVSDYNELASCIYIDACARCPADVSDLRDLLTIKSRTKHEGISFLTITLPNFCKGVEKALQQGYIDPSGSESSFRGFPYSGAIPAFLQGMLGQLFCQRTGRLYDEQNTCFARDTSPYLDCIRQICLAFKKVELGCTPERDAAAVSSFIATERFFSDFQATEEDTKEFLSVSSVLWDNLIFGLRHAELVPKHGPGATAEGISGNRKFSHEFWPKRLDAFFPLFNYAYTTSALDSREVELVTLIPEELELPVKVTLVPKTLKSPRVIAIEPVAMQYAQQGIRGVLYDAIESYWLTRGHINFRDQSINQSLAVTSSATGQLATIDLSEASDRVPQSLALQMFNAYPDFRDAIDSCRSRYAKLPDGRIIGPLKKFASMGSALCFPVESMYFYTICVAALLKFKGLPVSSRNIYLSSRDVYVYGDDIIVPTYAADTVVDYLQKYYCKVNTSKTFTKGNFRESCGVDAFRGKLVNPVYIRKRRPTSRRHGSELISWSETANLFFKKGFLRTSELMHSVCERILGFYPEIPMNCSGLGRNYPLGARKYRKRYNRRLQRLEALAFVPGPVYRTDALDGYAALFKSLLLLETKSRVDQPLGFVSYQQATLVDEKHLERSALHGKVTLTRRWVGV